VQQDGVVYERLEFLFVHLDVFDLRLLAPRSAWRFCAVDCVTRRALHPVF
jgi:hypothetical protein